MGGSQIPGNHQSTVHSGPCKTNSTQKESPSPDQLLSTRTTLIKFMSPKWLWKPYPGQLLYKMHKMQRAAHKNDNDLFYSTRKVKIWPLMEHNIILNTVIWLKDYLTLSASNLAAVPEQIPGSLCSSVLRALGVLGSTVWEVSIRCSRSAGGSKTRHLTSQMGASKVSDSSCCSFTVPGPRAYQSKW